MDTDTERIWYILARSHASFLFFFLRVSSSDNLKWPAFCQCTIGNKPKKIQKSSPAYECTIFPFKKKISASSICTLIRSASMVKIYGTSASGAAEPSERSTPNVARQVCALGFL
jgi:hypothetical protein